MRGIEGHAPRGGGNAEAAGSLLGHLFESLATLCLRVPAQAAEARVGHLRTRNGDHEVDLVLIRDDGKVLAVEVNLAASVEVRDTRHLHWLARQMGADLLDALIISTGPQSYRRPDRIGVVPPVSSPPDLPQPPGTYRPFVGPRGDLAPDPGLHPADP